MSITLIVRSHTYDQLFLVCRCDHRLEHIEGNISQNKARAFRSREVIYLLETTSVRNQLRRKVKTQKADQQEKKKSREKSIGGDRRDEARQETPDAFHYHCALISHTPTHWRNTLGRTRELICPN